MSSIPVFHRLRAAFSRPKPLARRTRTRRATLRLEPLEDRRLPTAYVVNSLADGAPVADGQLTLREAIQAASQNAAVGDAPAGSTGLDTITFAPNLAFGIIKLDPTQGVLFYGVGAGDLTISGPVAGNSLGLVISGQDQTRVLQLGSFAGAAQQFASDNVSIDSLTMTHGFGNAACFLNAAMTATLTSVAVTDSNNPSTNTAGIENAAILTLNRCLVAGNTAQTSSGIQNTFGTLTINDTRIVGNTATFGPSAGVFNFGGTMTIQRSTIAGNVANGEGGGLTASSGTTTIVACTISGNNSTGAGAGVLIVGGSTVFLLNCTIAGNISGGPGGGVRLDSTVNSFDVSIVNCTIAQNADTSNNIAGAGGLSWSGAEPGGRFIIANTILALNGAGPGSADANLNLAGSNAGIDLVRNFVGGDPKLGPLQDNGGPTFTMAPLRGSPIIDGGDNEAATITGRLGDPELTLDQRGARRLIDGDHNGSRFVDQGAVEFSPGPIHPLVAGADQGGAPEVKVFDGLTGRLRYDFMAFDPHFLGGVRVATADVTGDGVDDIIVAAGPSGGPQVNVYDGATGALVKSFFAMTPTITRGLFVAAGDVNKDGFADVIVGADAGGTPAVLVYDGQSLAHGTKLLIATFFAYDPGFTGGVHVAAADLNGDGFADVITGKGPGAAPRVRAFDGKALLSSQQTLLFDFMAFATSFTGGVYVAAGDTNGDGTPDIVAGAGAGGGPAVSVFSGKDGSALASFFAYGVNSTGGVRVSAADLNGDGFADVITGRGPGGEPTVKVFDGQSQQSLRRFDVLDLAFTGGVFVGGA